MIYSVTTTHFENENKYILLNYTIDSLLLNNINMCTLSISFDDETHYKNNEDKIKKMQTKYGEKIKIYIQTKKCCQFEHLQIICNDMASYVLPDDKILFCEDDDILLEMPDIETHEIIAGIQFLPGFVEDDQSGFNNCYQIKKMIEEEKDKFTVVNDFSGYVCPYKILLKFFHEKKFNFENSSNIEKKLNLFIDNHFMLYLNELNIYEKSKPFIYHRMLSIPDERQLKMSDLLENDEVIISKTELNNFTKKVDTAITMANKLNILKFGQISSTDEDLNPTSKLSVISLLIGGVIGIVVGAIYFKK